MAKTPSQAPADSADTGPPLGDMVWRVVIVFAVLFLIGYFFSRGGNFAKTSPTSPVLVDARPNFAAQRALCGVPSPTARPVPIVVLYSEDQRQWIEYAANRFARLCPNIQVKLTAMEDLAAVSALLAGGLRPTIWAPTDDLALQLLASGAQKAGQQAAWKIEERQELVHSPQVLLIWQDRLDVLSTVLREQQSDEGQWVRGLCAGIPREPSNSWLPTEQLVPGTWLDFAAPLLAPPLPPAPIAKVRRAELRSIRPAGNPFLPTAEQLQRWGQVKIVHPLPTRYLSGLSALYLLSYDFLVPPADRTALEPSDGPLPPSKGSDPAALGRLAQSYSAGFANKKESLRRWLRRCEAGVEVEPEAANLLTGSLFAAGPARYDGVVTYEQLVMPFLDKLDSTAGVLKKLVVVYPNPTRIARHPAVRFPATAEQSEAASRWLSYLLSTELQHKAILFGFRPGNPNLSIRDYTVEQNGFLRLRRFGILPQPILHEAPLPTGQQLQALMDLWGEATGRH
jgi:hypothetical protein